MMMLLMTKEIIKLLCYPNLCLINNLFSTSGWSERASTSRAQQTATATVTKDYSTQERIIDSIIRYILFAISLSILRLEWEVSVRDMFNISSKFDDTYAIPNN